MNHLSTCSLQEADVAFFPFFPRSYHLLQIPEDAKGKTILGFIKAPSIVAHKIYLKNQNSKIFYNNNLLEFSTFTHVNKLNENVYEEYWESLMYRIQKNNFPTIWVFMPEEAIIYLFNKIVCGQGKFYFYEETSSFPANNFILLSGENGLYSYLIQNPEFDLVSLS